MKKPLRFVTASSLFDGHDASINIIRRLLQKAGCEVVHIGHNRSVEEIVVTALQEDVDAIAVSSYQGGHMEFFCYMHDLLRDRGCGDKKIFCGGGGTILPSEIKTLHDYGIERVYHAEDGRVLGLEGMIRDMISRVDRRKRGDGLEEMTNKIRENILLSYRELARGMSAIEDLIEHPIFELLDDVTNPVPILGITGPGGAGKSSVVDEWVTRFLCCSKKAKVGILAFDPSKRKTGGALLGDRIRMNAVYGPQVFLRSMATRESNKEVGANVGRALRLMQHAGFDLIILETTGIGQGDASVLEHSDFPAYVMTSEYGASSQLEKIDMLDYAEAVVVNKFDKLGAESAFEDVLHTYADAHSQKVRPENRESFPIFGTIASNFCDKGITRFFIFTIEKLREKGFVIGDVSLENLRELFDEHAYQILPPERYNYLNEIAHTVWDYKKKTADNAILASQLCQLKGVLERYGDELGESCLQEKEKSLINALGLEDRSIIDEYFRLQEIYSKEEYEYEVRGKILRKSLFEKSLSETKIPRIARPQYKDWGDILRFMRMENFPGYFPYTAGVFPLKSGDEDPKRQFAGEGGPARTNKRFQYLCEGEKAKRLSTAFDSVTLYGEDPAQQPDIYGKVGNSGVSVATLDHAKTLYKGFNLIDPLTSVSLTINGPAPMILAMFLNAAIDFEVEAKDGNDKYESIRDSVLQKVRGTVQADILKEEMGQNTCIFSSKFALKLMGDIQEYFIKKKIRNFYSVSISGYHIAEAGSNPITQLALTLSNGFTYVEYYLARGMHIDDFALNLSFFFSCGLDPEYSVMGRVARRIWAVTLRDKYKANERSCKLKYHVQTSGRSLHAQELAFNDIRTTLQALISYYDFCNSLHTNAYDEAITTPTEDSVRRAMAIQMIISKEFGVAKCDNPMQGSFFYEELTEFVEEAVLCEFEALSRRGGVLGAMEKEYQRHKIQSESIKYETLKSNGKLPIIGVNTYISKENQPDYENIEIIRATEEEKQEQIVSTHAFIEKAGAKNGHALECLRDVVLTGGNVFEELMETVKYASLGQITHLLFQCGGKYRRSM